MRLGIGSYTFYWAVGGSGFRPERPLTVFDLLDRASELGVSVVQVCDNLPLAELSAAERSCFGSEARSRGITVELGARGLKIENLAAHLRLAEELQSPILRLVASYDGGAQGDASAIVDCLRPLLPGLASAGICLAIENTEALPARELVGVIEALGAGPVGACVDTVNSIGALETPRCVVDRLAPYCANLHVNDFAVRRVDYQVGFVVEGRPAGQGLLDTPWLLDRVRAAGRDPNAILELWTPPAGSLEETIVLEREWAASSIRYLRALLPETRPQVDRSATERRDHD